MPRWAAHFGLPRQHLGSILIKCNLHASVITGSRGTMVFFPDRTENKFPISLLNATCHLPQLVVNFKGKQCFFLLASGFALFYLQNWHFNCLKGIIFLHCLLLYFSQMALLVFKNEDHLTLMQLELIPAPL